MSLHDAYARLTPFELLFREPAGAETLARAVADEAEGRGADVEEPHAFVTMGAVAAFVREIQGEAAPSDSIHSYGALAWHALHFADAGFPLFLLGTHAARYLVEGRPGDAAEAPTPSGYLQFPQHLFWSEGVSGVPESVDGIFWNVTGSDALHVLLVTGLRQDRSALGVVPLPRAPASDAPTWIDIDARGDGSYFSNEMPGSELDALYALRTSGEVFKLLARFFAYAAAAPSALVAGEGGTGEEPEPSSLPFTRVTLTG
jgi:hypothetical protein